jgi:hypothetical protein
MRKQLVLLGVLLLFFSSCIPIKRAPNITDYKVLKGKKLKKSLGKKNFFVFKNEKNMALFSAYINDKFKPKPNTFASNIPVQLEGEIFYFTFINVPITEETADLFSPLLGAVAEKALGIDDVEHFDEFEDNNQSIPIYTNKEYFVAVKVHHDIEGDCLAENSLFRPIVLNYLRNLKTEFSNHSSYYDALFKM